MGQFPENFMLCMCVRSTQIMLVRASKLDRAISWDDILQLLLIAVQTRESLDPEALTAMAKI